MAMAPKPRRARASRTKAPVAMAPTTAPVTPPSAPQPPTGPAPVSPQAKGWETRRKRQADALQRDVDALVAASDPGTIAASELHADAPVSPAV